MSSYYTRKALGEIARLIDVLTAADVETGSLSIIKRLGIVETRT